MTGPFIPPCRGQDPYPHYLANDDDVKDGDDDPVFFASVLAKPKFVCSGISRHGARS